MDVGGSRAVLGVSDRLQGWSTEDSGSIIGVDRCGGGTPAEWHLEEIRKGKGLVRGSRGLLDTSRKNKNES